MPATATCPKCGQENTLLACQNCGSTEFRLGPLTTGAEGMICKSCNLGNSHFGCQAGCGAWIPAESFGTTGSRIARQIAKNMQEAEGAKCFIATELYGADSPEVALLRRFRDEVLQTTRLGTAFVEAYYRVSPQVIPLMRRFKLVRSTLGGIVSLCVKSVRFRGQRP